MLGKEGGSWGMGSRPAWYQEHPGCRECLARAFSWNTDAESWVISN